LTFYLTIVELLLALRA